MATRELDAAAFASNKVTKKVGEGKKKKKGGKSGRVKAPLPRKEKPSTTK